MDGEWIAKVRLTDWLTEWLTDWLTDWLIDWQLGRYCWRSRESLFDWLPSGAVFLERPRVPDWLNDWITVRLPSGSMFLEKPRVPDLPREVPCLLENQEFQDHFHNNSWVNSILNQTKPLCAEHTRTHTHFLKDPLRYYCNIYTLFSQVVIYLHFLSLCLAYLPKRPYTCLAGMPALHIQMVFEELQVVGD